MKLFIDTSSNQRTVISLNDKKLEVFYKKPQDQEILQLIKKLLVTGKQKLENISLIQINPGPGSYTSLRAGFSIANILSWALKIKINNKLQDYPIYE